jgi:hypothetical protein
MSLSRAFPAAVIFPRRKLEMRPATWAASLERASACLKRALRENPEGNKLDVSEVSEVAELRRERVGAGAEHSA